MDTSSVLSDDLSDYDVVSNPSQRSLESSIADLSHPSGRRDIREPSPLPAAREKFNAALLSAYDIQAYVRMALENLRTKTDLPSPEGTVRVYVDGVYDVFTTDHALQLRQAKLSFPAVHLMVGVFSDDICILHGASVSIPHVERCEVLRHCRWVDEVVGDAPWRVDDQLLLRRRIDYVALHEGSSVDPQCDKTRLKGYDEMRRLGKVIPTRKTGGLVAGRIPTVTLPTPMPPTPTPPPASLSAPESPAADSPRHVIMFDSAY